MTVMMQLFFSSSYEKLLLVFFSGDYIDIFGFWKCLKDFNALNILAQDFFCPATVKDDFQCALHTLESLFAVFVLFHLRDHKM